MGDVRLALFLRRGLLEQRHCVRWCLSSLSFYCFEVSGHFILEIII